jgi:hypothetical protein
MDPLAVVTLKQALQRAPTVAEHQLSKHIVSYLKQHQSTLAAASGWAKLASTATGSVVFAAMLPASRIAGRQAGWLVGAAN